MPPSQIPSKFCLHKSKAEVHRQTSKAEGSQMISKFLSS